MADVKGGCARGLHHVDERPETAGERIIAATHGNARIRLAYAFDPYFAVSLSGIRALPHQLEAVYERLLPQPRLRFVLAHDPGMLWQILTARRRVGRRQS